MDLGKLPVFLENKHKGNYTVHLDPAANGTDCAISATRATMAIRRSRSGCGTGTSATPSRWGSTAISSTRRSGSASARPARRCRIETSPYNPGPEWRKKWATLDVEQANQLLDKIGLTRRTPKGIACGPTTARRLRIEMVTVGGSFIPFPQIGEMISKQLQEDRPPVRRNPARALADGEARGRQRAPDGALGRTTAPSCCSGIRTTRLAGLTRPVHRAGDSANGTPRTASRA